MSGSLSYAVVRRGHQTHLSSVLCTLGRTDRPYPEVHEHGAWTFALVRRGTFRYRGSATDARPLLRPGWLLLGRPGCAFECSHEHDGGDACTSLVVPEGVVEDAARVAGRPLQELIGTTPALPPLAKVDALIELARAGRDVDLDEIGCLIAACLVGHATGAPLRDGAGTRSDTDRAHDAMARIEDGLREPLSLGALAHASGLSSFHFLRVFRRVTGVTPHQYLITARLRLAVRLLLDTELPVTRVASDAGFQDLSNFNHTFRRVVGCAPRAYRRGRI